MTRSTCRVLPYPVHVGHGLLDALTELVPAVTTAHRIAVITDDVVGPLYAAQIAAQLGEERSVLISIAPGEEYKTRLTWARITDALLEAQFGRDSLLIALGGGVVGDLTGFVAATYLRGVPLIHVPTTLVAQIDSSIGGKTGVDLPEGKNLVGAFHLPEATIIDVAVLGTLPERQRRAALGEAVKMAALGDERLFELLESDGAAIVAGSDSPADAGIVAELVERCAWAKVEVVVADEREHDATGGRITLNLGHSAGHALEVTAGYNDLLHGEAVAYGLRVACAIGRAVGVTPADRADRIMALLDELGLATQPLDYPLETVMAHLASDKKHAAGVLRWVLPTADRVVVRSGVEPTIVERAVQGVLATAASR